MMCSATIMVIASYHSTLASSIAGHRRLLKRSNTSKNRTTILSRQGHEIFESHQPTCNRCAASTLQWFRSIFEISPSTPQRQLAVINCCMNIPSISAWEDSLELYSHYLPLRLRIFGHHHHLQLHLYLYYKLHQLFRLVQLILVQQARAVIIKIVFAALSLIEIKIAVIEDFAQETIIKSANKYNKSSIAPN